MKCHLTPGLAMAAVLLVLPACSLIGKVPPADERPADDLQSWSLVVDGERVDDLRADPEKLKAKVRELLGTDPWSDDEARKAEGKPSLLDERTLRAFEEGRVPQADIPDALKGIGGFTALGLLRAAIGERQVITGKIRDYVYDKAERSGHLAVDTWVKIYRTPRSFITDAPDATLRYHWDIEVEGIYVEQEHTGDDLNPFPGPVEFTDEAKREIKARGLKYKLFAQGEKIVVRHVYQVFEDGTILRLDDEHPFYEQTKESCIDILFDREPPAIDLPPQRGYCLGRCDKPQVVNTGA